MTDPDLVSNKIARIEVAVQELRTIARPDLLRDDILQQRFVERTLQIAIQAAMDVASHVVADEYLGEPRTAREIFALLGRRDVIDRSLAARLELMVGFRNIVVHEYDNIDLDKVREILAHHLDDLLDFARIMRARL